MSTRITNGDLDSMFDRMVQAAIGAGKTTHGWSFGQHTGKLYSVVNYRAGMKRVSPLWHTKREAWQGLYAMARAFEA